MALMGTLNCLSVRTYYTTNRLLTQILEWLWDAAIWPVLEFLGYLDVPSKDELWPHVWWIPVGWLSLFPLHAAGYHRPGSSRNALDRVISSYSPTLKAFVYSTQKGSKNSAKQHAVLVSMPQTPCQKDLPQALNEVNLLNDLLPADVEMFLPLPRNLKCCPD
jgi:CHAT domain